MTSVETLVIVHKDNKVLLGLKKRGFGKNKWNGFGGKLEKEDNGDLERCVCRETKQECGIDLKNLKNAGDTLYVFEGDEQDHLVRIYTTDCFEGYPRETDEMRWKWFDVDKIPYDANEVSDGFGMWKNDRFWMPYLLSGKYFKAGISMTAEGETLSCVINGKEYMR